MQKKAGEEEETALSKQLAASRRAENRHALTSAAHREKLYTKNKQKRQNLLAALLMHVLFLYLVSRALADILRQQGPIPISQYDCENFAAMNGSPKDNTPVRTSSKNHYTPVHSSKSNHGKSSPPSPLHTQTSEAFHTFNPLPAACDAFNVCIYYFWVQIYILLQRAPAVLEPFSSVISCVNIQ